MTAFLKSLGYKTGSGLNSTINTRFGSTRYEHPDVPGHSILAFTDKKTGKHKFMSTPASDHPKHTDTQVFDRDFDAVRHGAGHHMEKVPLKKAFEETEIEEGFVKKRRRKPLHRKTLMRKRAPKLQPSKRSVLRMGDELLRFSDFMGEGRYNDDGDIHDCHDEDHHDGYKAGVEFHMGSGILEDNPHDREKHPECHASWKEGFEQAGEDS